MVDRPRTRTAKIRASFGRAERLRREAQSERGAARGQPERETDRKAARQRDARSAKRESVQTRAERQQQQQRDTSRRERATAEQARTRLDRHDEREVKHRQERQQEQVRTEFRKAAERRHEQARRAQHERKQRETQTALKRAQDQRQRADREREQRKRDEARRSFNRQADRRQDQARRRETASKAGIEAQRERDLQRAAARTIEAHHKRQLADQQVEHRRQTSQVRSRHQADTRSLRSNENVALERHHHAVKGIDERERGTLADFDGRRAGLAGRIVERIPGRREENDRLRAEMVRGFESERLTKHRDLEALKERQFAVAQKARLDQAKERMEMMRDHRDGRTHLKDRQTADRPRPVEHQARVIERVERDRTAEKPPKEMERDRPTLVFGRA